MLPATVRVCEVPAFITHGSPTVTWLIEFTVTSFAPAVRVNVVNGTLEALCGASELAGCVLGVTVSAPPCGRPGVTTGGTTGGVTTTPPIVLSLPRVNGPT